jgi:hypothetical protein
MGARRGCRCGGQFTCHYSSVLDSFCTTSGALAYETVQDLPGSLPNLLKASVTAALHGTYHNRCVALVAAPLAFDLATDKGLVYFCNALEQLCDNLFERVADSMREIPSCFIGVSERALELISRDTLFRLHDKVNCQKPLPQRKVCIMEDGASGDRELVAALVLVAILHTEDVL